MGDYASIICSEVVEKLTKEYQEAMNRIYTIERQIRSFVEDEGVIARVGPAPDIIARSENIRYDDGIVTHMTDDRVFTFVIPRVLPVGRAGRAARVPETPSTFNEYVRATGELISTRNVLPDQFPFENKLATISPEPFEDETTIVVSMRVGQLENFKRHHRFICRDSEGNVIVPTPFSWDTLAYAEDGTEYQSYEDFLMDQPRRSAGQYISFVFSFSPLVFKHQGSYVEYTYDHESVHEHVILSFTIGEVVHKYRVAPGTRVFQIFFFRGECYYLAGDTKQENPYGITPLSITPEIDGGDHDYIVIHAASMMKSEYFTEMTQRMGGTCDIYYTDNFVSFSNPYDREGVRYVYA